VANVHPKIYTSGILKLTTKHHYATTSFFPFCSTGQMGMTVAELNAITRIDKWFLQRGRGEGHQDWRRILLTGPFL